MTNVAGDSVPQSARRLVWRVLLLEWAGTLLCLLLGAAWLQIADSHLWQFAFSVVSGIFLVLAFCWIQLLVFQNLRRPAVLAALWRRLLLFLVILGLWLLLLSWIGIGQNHAPDYAGYWNSKLSPSLRYLATYERLVSWQLHFWSLVEWLLAAFLLPVVMEGGTAGISSLAWKRILGVYGHWRYWLAAVVCGFAGSAVVAAFVAWKPGTGVAQQIVSVLVRLGVAYTVVILFWSFMLSLTASYLEQKNSESAEVTNP